MFGANLWFLKSHLMRATEMMHIFVLLSSEKGWSIDILDIS